MTHTVRRVPRYENHCLHCGMPFMAYRSTDKFCCKQCRWTYKNALRRRQKLERAMRKLA